MNTITLLAGTVTLIISFLNTLDGRWPVPLGMGLAGLGFLVIGAFSLRQFYSRAVDSAYADARREIERRVEAEARLRRNQAMLLSVLNSTNDLVAAVDKDFRILCMNEPMHTLMSRFKGDIPDGTYALDVVPEDQKEILRRTFDEVIQGRAVTTTSTRFDAAGRVRFYEESFHPIVCTSGETAGMTMYARDVTERVESENALRESEQRFRLLSEATFEGITVIESGIIREVNDQFAAMHGYTREELLGRPVTDVIAPESRERVVEAMAAGDESEPVEFIDRRKDGSLFPVEVQARHASKGDRFFGVNVIRDITARQTAEQLLRHSEAQFRSLFENAILGIYCTAPDGTILMVNPALCRMLGYASAEELLERNLEMDGFEPEYPRNAFKERLERDGMITGYESSWTRADGSKLCIRENAKAVRDASGAILFYEGTVEDITEHKMAEEQVAASLREKEILLKEIHHRVKNNMQVICSLLNLQAGYIHDPDVLEMFDESQRRVRAMAAIHEKLYRSENMASINFGQYLETVTNELTRSYRKEGVVCSVDADAVFLGLDIALPCGLIVNELVSNALKHGYPGGRGGQIRVTLRENSDGMMELCVEDDGIGFPAGQNFQEMESMGMTIVNALASQLSGIITLEQDAGTKFTVIFPGC